MKKSKLILNIKRIVYPLIVIVCALIIIFLGVAPFLNLYKYDSLYNNQSTVIGTVISSEKAYINYFTKVNVNNSIVNIKTSSFMSKGTELELIETDENKFMIKSEIEAKTTSLNHKGLYMSIDLVLSLFMGLLLNYLSDDYQNCKRIYYEKLKKSKKDEICKIK